MTSSELYAEKYQFSQSPIYIIVIMNCMYSFAIILMEGECERKQMIKRLGKYERLKKKTMKF